MLAARHERLRARDGIDGVVFAGMGNGILRVDRLKALSRASKRRVRIVRASRAANGTTVRDGGIDDDTHGFVSGDTLASPQARTLPMLGLEKPAELQAQFSHDRPSSCSAFALSPASGGRGDITTSRKHQVEIASFSWR